MTQSLNSYCRERAADTFFQRLTRIRSIDDQRAQDTQPLDLQLDDITGLQPAAGGFWTQLKDASGADGAGADEVAGEQLGVARCVFDDLRPGEIHIRRLAAREFFAVDARVHA